MIRKIVNLGGPAKYVRVAPVGHGLMCMTVRPETIPDEQCFEAIKAGIDELPEGVKMFLNSAVFYDNEHKTGNLELLARFFEKYPGYSDKTFLSVKGGLRTGTLSACATEENIRQSVNRSIEALRGTKKIDLFVCARVDADIPIEQQMETLMKLVGEGLFEYIGLSECNAETLRRACKVAPVVSAEIEVSLWSYEEETKKVIAAAQELGVNIHGYSPVGHGMLAGAFKKPEELAEKDFRNILTRFKGENFAHNYQIVPVLQKQAAAHNPPCTIAQLSIAWVFSLGDHVLPLPGSSKKERTLENLYAGDIELSEAEKMELITKVGEIGIVGGRYNEHLAQFLWG